MDVYIYQAALLCCKCTNEVCITLSLRDIGNNGDSDHYPQGPYPNGGGEADCPQHCDHCCTFLENPLTDDGVSYTINAVQDGRGDQPTLDTWADFYHIKKQPTVED